MTENTQQSNGMAVPVSKHETMFMEVNRQPGPYHDIFLQLEKVLGGGFSDEGLQAALEDDAGGIPVIARAIRTDLTESCSLMEDAMRAVYQGEMITCHSLNVAVLSYCVSTVLGLTDAQKDEIIIAALVHDTGMKKIDVLLYNQNKKITRSERSEIERHPILGAEILDSVKYKMPWLHTVALEEHCREDGSGYPGTVDTKGMHLYSKIIGLCDVFEAMTHFRPYRKAYHPADIMKKLIKGNRKRFPVDLFKGLIEAVSLYPVGSFVMLNNERIAKVVKAVKGNPLSPDIKIIRNTQTEPEICNLANEPNVNIAGVVYDEHYQPLEENG